MIRGMDRTGAGSVFRFDLCFLLGLVDRVCFRLWPFTSFRNWLYWIGAQLRLFSDWTMSNFDLSMWLYWIGAKLVLFSAWTVSNFDLSIQKRKCGRLLLYNKPEMEQPYIIACFTTIPSRLHLLCPMIDSLVHQTKSIDQILLFLPKWSSKEKCEYDIRRLYASIHTNLQRCPPNLQIVTVNDDYGPMTKLYPIFEWVKDRHLPRNTVILSIDDDKIYNCETVARLVGGYQRNPGCVVGISGWIMGSPCPAWINVRSAPDIPCDWVEATNGVLYPLDRLKRIQDVLVQFDRYNCREAKTCDDIWISAWWQEYNPDKRIVCVPLQNDYRSRLHKSTDAGTVNALRMDGKHQQSSAVEQWQGRIRMGLRNANVALYLRDSVMTCALQTPLSMHLMKHMVSYDTCMRYEWIVGIIMGIVILVLLLLVILVCLINWATNAYWTRPNASRVAKVSK